MQPSFYGAPATAEPLAWSWVDAQLAAAGTYWVVAQSTRWPHPRPVWGIWSDERLLLSIGSPVVARQAHASPDVTVHLDSGTDVVVLEGRVAADYDLATFLTAYNEKYDWNYTLDEYGPPTVIEPRLVLAWRSAGWAGREGFVAAGKWSFDRTA